MKKKSVLFLKWLFIFSLVSGIISAQNEDDLINEINQLRLDLNTIFENLNPGTVQGNIWISKRSFETIVRSIDPIEVYFNQVTSIVPSSGGVPRPEKNVIPIKRVSLGPCNIVIGTQQGSLRGTLSLQTPIPRWIGTSAATYPLQISLPSKLVASSALRVYLTGSLCPNINIANCRINLLLEDTPKIGLSFLKDNYNRFRYSITYINPTTINGTGTITGILGLSDIDLTLHIEPQEIYHDFVPSIYKNNGVLEIKDVISKNYSFQITAKDLKYASDGLELFYQFNLIW